MKRFYCPVFAFSFLLLSNNAQAYFVDTTHLTDNSSTVNVDRIAEYDTTGATMFGLTVTVNFADGNSETVDWDLSKGAVGTIYNWSLGMVNYYGTSADDMHGSTFGDSALIPRNYAFWIFDTGENFSAVTSLVLDGNLVDSYGTVFDLFLDRTLTANSANGAEFTVIKSKSPMAEDLTITPTYSNEVALTGKPALGDLWETLTLVFESPTSGGFTSTDTLVFRADTDTAIPSPEPTTMLLFGIGASGLVGASLRRKK